MRSVGLQSYELNWLTYIVQDFVVCGDRLCYSLADEGTQEKKSPDESCITGEGHRSPFHLMANSKMVSYSPIMAVHVITTSKT